MHVIQSRWHLFLLQWQGVVTQAKRHCKIHIVLHTHASCVHRTCWSCLEVGSSRLHASCLDMFGLTVAISTRTLRNNIARSKPKGNGTSTSFENTAPWRRWIQHSSVFSRTLAAICCNSLPQLYHLNLMTVLLDDIFLGKKHNDIRKPGPGYNMLNCDETSWNRGRMVQVSLSCSGHVGFLWQDAWVPATGFLRRRGQDMHDGAWGASLPDAFIIVRVHWLKTQLHNLYRRTVASQGRFYEHIDHDDSMLWSRGIWYLSPLDHNAKCHIPEFVDSCYCRGEIPTADSTKRNVNQQVQEAL